MMSTASHWWTVLVFALHYCPIVGGLKCAQCSSLSTSSCQTGEVEAVECAGLYQGARFCVTYSGDVRRGRVVFRDCTYVNMQTLCRSQLLENYQTEVCYETCSSDGCNAVPSTCSTRWGSRGHVIALLGLVQALHWM